MGASRTRGKIGSEIFHNLIASGFTGTISAVHPSASAIESHPAYRSVSDIPGDVDLAIVSMPAADVLDAVDDCVTKGVRGICVISAGFAETGPEGAAREAELLARISAAPAAPRTLNPAIPDSVNSIVVRLLEPDPEKRFATTQELVAALDRLAPDGSVRSDVHEVIVHDAPARSKLAVAALVIVLAGAGAGWVMSRGYMSGPVSAAHEPISVLIGDFENRTGDAMFDGVVEQALSLGIEGASFINSYSRRDAMRAAEAIKPGSKLDESTARLVAFRENLGLAVVGAVEPKGGGYHITIKGVGPGPDGETKFTLEDDAGSKAEVLQTVGALAAKVRTALGDTVAPVASDAFTAANLEVVREYAKGQQLFASGKLADAIPAFIAATKLDEDFGRGYSSAATAAANLGRREEADKYYNQALAKIDRMTDREKMRTRGQYYLFSRNGPKAIEEFTALVQKYPSDVVGLGNLALAHFQLRQFDQAMAIGKRVADMFPSNPLRQKQCSMSRSRNLVSLLIPSGNG